MIFGNHLILMLGLWVLPSILYTYTWYYSSFLGYTSQEVIVVLLNG